MAAKTYLSEVEYAHYSGALPPANFVMLEMAARKRIDYLTASRVASMAEVPEAVKICMVALIRADSKLGLEAQSVSPLVTSYSTDGYTETYGKMLGVSEASGAMDSLVKSYLYGEKDDNGIPLLYRGVEHDASL